MTAELLIKDPNEIPIEVLYGNSTVQELLSKIENSDLEKDIKIPYVIKDKILMSPGVWNGLHYSANSLKDAFLKTSWDKKEIRSLFLDHVDKSSREWVGEVKNARVSNEDIIGDLIIVDKPTAMKLAYGAKMGISPKVHGQEDNGHMLSFLFDNFSVVINPAVKTAYINNAQKEAGKMEEEDEFGDNDEELAKKIKPEEMKKEEKPIDEKKKYPYPEEKMEKELSDDKIEEMVEEELARAGKVGSIAKKAKEIRKEGESWQAAIKRAAKMMNEQEDPSQKTDRLLNAVSELVELLKKKEEVPVQEKCKKKEEYPLPEEQKQDEELQKKKPAAGFPQENPQAPTGKPATKFEEVHEQKLSQIEAKLAEVERKLNEPNKITEKSEELIAQPVNADVGMLNFIKNEMGIGG